MDRRDFLKGLIAIAAAPVSVLSRLPAHPPLEILHVWGCEFYVSEYAKPVGPVAREVVTQEILDDSIIDIQAAMVRDLHERFYDRWDDSIFEGLEALDG